MLSHRQHPYSKSQTNIQLEENTFTVLTGGGGGDVGDASIRTCVELAKKTLEVCDYSVRTVEFSCSPVFIKFAEGSIDLIRIS